MANNRIFVKCNVCGESFFLAKSMGSGFYTSRLNVNQINEFFDLHTFCLGKGDEGDYSLEYEDPPHDDGSRRK